MKTFERWTMVAAILGTSMVFLDGTIMNLALPRIGEELPGTIFSRLEGQTYAVSGYLAILAALLILAGALGDYYGRRRIFAIGLTGFGITSVLCGLAPTLELLVIARLLQGAAGALLVPGSLAILTALFEGPARARAIGIWASATSATTLLGPVIGGLLVDGVSWRAAFLINVPLVAIALFATIRYMPETRSEEATGNFDWLGAGVAVVAVGGLAFGAIRGTDRNWQDPIAWISLAIGAIALVAFPFLMARRPNPLVPPGQLRRRHFATINLSTLLIYGALYTVLYIQGLFLQGVVGYTATAAGLIGVPSGIMLTLLSARIGTLAGRHGARRFLVAGPILMALGLLWLARVPPDTAPWQLAIADPTTYLPPASTLVHVMPIVQLFGFGLSHVDEHADVVRAGWQRGARIGDQQLDLAGGAATAGGGDLRRHLRGVLRVAGRGRAGRRPERPGAPGPGPAAQPAGRGHAPGCRAGGDGGLGRCAPPGGRRVRGAARGGRAHQRHRAEVAGRRGGGTRCAREPGIDGARDHWLSRATCTRRTAGTAPRTTASPIR